MRGNAASMTAFNGQICVKHRRVGRGYLVERQMNYQENKLFFKYTSSLTTIFSQSHIETTTSSSKQRFLDSLSVNSPNKHLSKEHPCNKNHFLSDHANVQRPCVRRLHFYLTARRRKNYRNHGQSRYFYWCGECSHSSAVHL